MRGSKPKGPPKLSIPDAEWLYFNKKKKEKKRGNGHGLATHWGNHQTASPDRPSNRTYKAKRTEDDLETPGVETQSQNWKSRHTTGTRQ